MPMSPRLLRPRAAATNIAFPQTLPGLQVWIDASDTGTLRQGTDSTTAAVSASNDPVGYVASKTGGHVFTQSIANNRPLWIGGSRPLLRFNGTSSSLASTTSVTLTTTRTVVFVLAHNNSAFFLEHSNNYNNFTWASHYVNTTQNWRGSGTGYFLPTYSGAPDFGTFAVRFMQHDGAANAHGYWVNNATTALSGSGGGSVGSGSLSQPLFIGSRNGGSFFFNGDISEILIYSTYFTADQRAAMWGYLQPKWRL